MFAKFGAGLKGGGCGVGGGLEVVGNELVDESGLIHCGFVLKRDLLFEFVDGVRCLLERVGWIVRCFFLWSMSCSGCWSILQIVLYRVAFVWFGF